MKLSGMLAGLKIFREIRLARGSMDKFKDNIAAIVQELSIAISQLQASG